MLRENISTILVCDLYWVFLCKRRQNLAKICALFLRSHRKKQPSLTFAPSEALGTLCPLHHFSALYCCQAPSLSSSPSARSNSYKLTFGFYGTTACLNLSFQRKSAPWLLQKLFQKTLEYLNVLLKMNLVLRHPVHVSLFPQVSTWISELSN